VNLFLRIQAVAGNKDTDGGKIGFQVSPPYNFGLGLLDQIREGGVNALIYFKRTLSFTV
jgi:hypothetical protein